MMTEGKQTSTALKVFVRIRPPVSSELNSDEVSAIVTTSTSSSSIAVKTEKNDFSCSFDYVFNELHEQENVFEKVYLILTDVLSGVNSCIFTYGQTGIFGVLLIGRYIQQLVI